MARVLLVNPPSPEPVRSPLLAFCHLAASLRAAGHTVAVLDAAAPHGPTEPGEILARARGFGAELVGLHLKTIQVQPAYALARVLAAAGLRLVAGGPHATVCPDEPLGHGFDYVVRGEGEYVLAELADAIDGGRGLDTIDGLTWKTALGPRHNPERGFILDLDALPSPLGAVELFDPAWYGSARAVPPSGVLSSRGCPAACTFCSNNVTGRRFRYRGAEAIADELRQRRDRWGVTAFNFFDDSFAVGRRRLLELCAALARVKGLQWACTAHPSHLDRETLSAMKAAGCVGLDIGMESGDPEMLLRIGKGVTVERVRNVLRDASALGMHVVVNLMFGWPDETEAELDATVRFLEEMAPLVGGYNARGVVVPYPGTPIYDQHHARHGFTEWWLREAPIDYLPFPTAWSQAEVQRAYAADAALERNFFHHPPERLARIARALERKAEVTFAVVERNSRRASQAGVAAAGAR